MFLLLRNETQPGKNVCLLGKFIPRLAANNDFSIVEPSAIRTYLLTCTVIRRFFGNSYIMDMRLTHTSRSNFHKLRFSTHHFNAF